MVSGSAACEGVLRDETGALCLGFARKLGLINGFCPSSHFAAGLVNGIKSLLANSSSFHVVHCKQDKC